jgi:DNA polymerase V
MKLRSLNKTPTLKFYFPDYSTALKLPFFDVGFSAGFPILLTISLN